MPTKANEPLLPNRVVIDTNVWISAILSSKGNPAEVVARAAGSLAHVFSQDTFSELETRIWKPKFDRYVSRETRQLLLHDASASANWVEIPPTLASQTFSRTQTTTNSFTPLSQTEQSGSSPATTTIYSCSDRSTVYKCSPPPKCSQNPTFLNRASAASHQRVRLTFLNHMTPKHEIR